MKKLALYLALLAFVCLSTVALIAGCEVVVAPQGEVYIIIGWFSFPVIYITDGSANFSNPWNPVTGTSVTNATVIVSNETTGVTREAVYSAANGYYTPAQELLHSAGQSVSLSIRTTSESITGSATVTPDPAFSSLSQASNSTVTLPFTVSWEVSQGTYEASRAWLSITSLTTTAETSNYQVVVPISQKSVTLTSSQIAAGSNYYIRVFGVNVMSLGGAKSGSVVYVGGGNTVLSTGITIEDP